MRRVLLSLLIGVPLLAAALALSAWWLALHSTTGAGLLVGFGQDALAGRLAYERLRGDLASGLELRRLAYQDETLRLSAARARLVATPAFRPLRLHVRSLELEDLRVERIAPVNDKPGGGLPDSLAPPLPIELDRLVIAGIHVTDQDGGALFEALRFSAAASVFGQLELRDVRLETRQGQASGNARLQLSRPYVLDAESDAELQILYEGWPRPLDIRARLRLDGREGAYRLGATGQAVSGPFELQADGALDLAAGTVSGRFDWREFAWPPGGETPRIASREGSVTASGTLDAWTVSGNASVESPGLPRGRLRFDATGDREQVNAEVREGHFLGGTLSGRVGYRWAGDGRFEADLQVQRLATATLFPDWPAELSGSFAARGRTEPPEVEVDIARLEGVLHGQALTASGHASHRDGELGFRQLDIRSGASRVSLDGSLDRAGGLGFDADIRDLGAFLADGGGRLQAQGTLARVNGRPRVEADVLGHELSWRGARLPLVEVRQRPASRPGSLSTLDIELTEPQFNGHVIDRARLEVNLSESRQDVSLIALHDGRQLAAGLSGGLVDPSLPVSAWRWQGELDAFNLEAEDQRLLTLTAPAALDLGPDLAGIETACMTAGRESRLCLEGRWERGAGASAHLALEHSPLSLIAPLLGQQIEFTQEAQGELFIARAADGRYEGMADVQLSPGVLRYPDDPEPILETGPGRLGFRLIDGAIRSGRLNIPLPGQGEIDMDFAVPDVALGLDAPLAGHLRVGLHDLDLLTLFLPIADEISGRLEADLALSGTAHRPFTTGRIRLADGVIANRSSGLRLSEIELSGEVAGEGQTRMTGRFRATEGAGRLEALVDLGDLLSPRVALGVQGEGLTLFDSEDLKVHASPDLLLEWKSGALHVGGRLEIPRARVAPTLIPSATVAESGDVRFTSGEPAGPRQKANGDESHLEIHGGLEVILGDRVRVDLDVADVDVSGRVVFNWQGGLMPLASGSFVTNGEVLAYGQLLEITEGRLSFPDVPANDPQLHVRAERDIFGNSEIRRAGLLITGSLKRPLMEPYTDPASDRERARTLLITGSDFNMERGVGAVSVGAYVAPRIFVRYGLGLFDQDSVISVRYELGGGWGVMATSGEQQTGVDISYTVDR